MIKRLRKKFVLINMSLAALVLVVVFTAIAVNSYRRAVEDSYQSLSHALEAPQGKLLPKIDMEPEKRPDNPQPREKDRFFFASVFVASVDSTGKILSIDNSALDISQDLAEKAVDAALEDGKERGYLKSMAFRYLREEEDEGGMRIAFADVSQQASSIRHLLLISSLIFLASLGAFWVISLFLSRWALAPVEEAWEQQRQFVADASHELKTPLTVILANLGILSSHPEATIRQQQKWLDNTQAEAGRMKKLLDNLLFLAKSDSSSLPVLKTSFDMSNALWSSLLPFESIAYEQDVDMVEDIQPDIFITGDETQLKQLFAILLDNACKYAGHGSVMVTLALVQNKILLSVNNSGDTIPPEDLGHVFERFYRSDKSRSRKAGGYGLGLSIAAAIVKNHKGRIKVTSDKEKGTTFSVWFPVEH